MVQDKTLKYSSLAIQVVTTVGPCILFILTLWTEHKLLAQKVESLEGSLKVCIDTAQAADKKTERLVYEAASCQKDLGHLQDSFMDHARKGQP